MKLQLKEFQTERITELVRRLRQAARGVRDGDLEAVSLASPTGSGKTVMATAAIELLLTGDATAPPQPDATFLWITDQPELNEQTRRKMLAASSLLGAARLVVLGAPFDQETLTPGTVNFLNTQKLSRNAGLVTPGDRRTHTIWETIGNTLTLRPGRFYVFIDEAHRGMAENPRVRNEATTIIQKFLKGSPGEIPPIPLIVGISATPERFNRLLEGQAPARTARAVVVTPEEVRESGLLKERITLYHPAEDQPSDLTMLRAAARTWQRFTRHWSTYCTSQGEPGVRPVLVVQVQDGVGRQLSRTDLGEVIANIDDEVGPLPADTYAHAFQEGSRLTIAGRELRYLAPADIDADAAVQVIFFKMSLNTGWDCPRAEVMMSFRTAVDATFIAQLVGRMVRTPLARRVDADPSLNSVALYLPRYDERGLASVVQRLSTPDPDLLPPVELEQGDQVLTLRRAEFMQDVFEALERLPSYVIPRLARTSEVRRLMKLGRLLAYDGIDPDGPERAIEIILGLLRAEHCRLKDTDQFKKIVEEQGKLEVRAVDWQLYGGLDDDAQLIELDIAATNVDDLFEAAGRKLGEGLHKAWWRARVEQDGSVSMSAKLELFALLADGLVLRAIEAASQQVVQRWLQEHRVAIAHLPESRQQAYGEVRRLATDAELAPLQYPGSIDGKKNTRTWTKHLYVDGYGVFPTTFNRWETQVIDEELARPDVVAWLRNPDRRPWSLCVPYQLGGESRSLYPDFLIVRQTPDGLVVDLLDPHSVDLADAPAKAAGLAQYAAKHSHEFGRIELIIVEGTTMKRLDLAQEQVRDRVKGVQTTEHLKQLFALEQGVKRAN